MTYYWYTTCSFCDHQGRLIITRNINEDALYLHCDECERGWRNPEKIKDVSASFLTLLEDFETDYPTGEEIREAGWEQYMKNILEN